MNHGQQALHMLSKIESELTRVNGQLQQLRQVRLLKTLESLLEFKSEESAKKWLEEKCRDCGESRLHHVDSVHSTLHLMEEIAAAKVFKTGDRVVRIETGETGTVR